MACSVVRTPLLRGPTVRRYAAAAAAQSCSSVAPEVSVLSNKVTVATLDNNSPISQVSIVFRAGSRNETYETQGLAYHLRIAAGLTTARSSTFAITRNIQQLGGNLIASTDRETIAYTLQITKDNLGEALSFLEDVATRQVFKPWELVDQIPRMKYILSSVPHTTRVVELLHKAAYRTGLGYSLYSPKYQLGKFGTETLQHFVNTWCTASRCSIVATGVPLSELTALGTNLELPSGDSANEPSKYQGGELRKERNSQLTTVAVATEGVSLSNEKDAIACAVLQRAAGSGPRVKWGTTVSPLQRQVAGAAGNDPFAVSTFNASYSDSGLFGFVLSAAPNIAGALTKSAVKWLKSANLSEADVTRGKNILKAEILCGSDNCTSMLEALQQEVSMKGSVSTPAAMVDAVDKISVSNVKSVADKIAKGKLSMAAIGDLRTVPHLDQLN